MQHKGQSADPVIESNLPLQETRLANTTSMAQGQWWTHTALLLLQCVAVTLSSWWSLLAAFILLACLDLGQGWDVGGQTCWSWGLKLGKWVGCFLADLLWAWAGSGNGILILMGAFSLLLSCGL